MSRAVVASIRVSFRLPPVVQRARASANWLSASSSPPGFVARADADGALERRDRLRRAALGNQHVAERGQRVGHPEVVRADEGFPAIDRRAQVALGLAVAAEERELFAPVAERMPDSGLSSPNACREMSRNLSVAASAPAWSPLLLSTLADHVPRNADVRVVCRQHLLLEREARAVLGQRPPEVSSALEDQPMIVVQPARRTVRDRGRVA